VPRLWEMVLGLAAYERLQDKVSGTAEGLAGLMFDGQGGLDGLVAVETGELIGYALYYMTCSSFRTRRGLWLEDLFVEPDRRGTGAGRLLFVEVARVALARGCHRLDWIVLGWNEPAMEFYRRQGAAAIASDWVQFGVDEDGLRRATGEPRAG